MGLFHTLQRAFVAPKRRGYSESAGMGRRLIGWQPTEASINTLLASDADIIRARARDMVRKNTYAANAVDAIVANCIGTGIKPLSKVQDEEFHEAVQQLWTDWSDEADADNRVDFYGLQALACRSVIEGGECLIRFRPRRIEDGLSVPLQLQILEAEHLDGSKTHTLANGNVVRSGIEFNAIGQRVAYYLYREHPGESSLKSSGESIRTPANSVLHLYKPLRPGQIRGESWLGKILVKLNELDQYDDAELVRKKTAAMFAGFITKLDPEGQFMGEGDADETGVSFGGLEPGTMQVLEPGEDVRFSDPSDVGGTYEAFMRQQLRSIAIGMGITYEQLTGDLTGVNYSSIRAGLIEFRRRCEMLQHQVVVFQMCRPIWKIWMEQAVLANALPVKIREFRKNPRTYLRAKWIPQGWDWVDPEKDMRAVIAAIRAGLISRSEAVSELGYDAEEIDREIARDNARADDLGLVFDTDPRKVAQNGAQSASATEDSNQPED